MTKLVNIVLLAKYLRAILVTVQTNKLLVPLLWVVNHHYKILATNPWIAISDESCKVLHLCPSKLIATIEITIKLQLYCPNSLADCFVYLFVALLLVQNVMTWRCHKSSTTHQLTFFFTHSAWNSYYILSYSGTPDAKENSATINSISFHSTKTTNACHHWMQIGCWITYKTFIETLSYITALWSSMLEQIILATKEMHAIWILEHM